MFGLFEIVQTIAVAAIPIAVGYLAKLLNTPKDYERAAEIKTIARAAAAFVVINNQNDKWVSLVNLVVNQIADQLPTGNKTVARAAAEEAVTYWMAHREKLPPAAE